MEKLRKLWKLIFGRTGMFIFLLAIQAVIIFGGLKFLNDKLWFFNYTIGLIAVIVLIYILNVRQNSSFKLMWIILILMFPIVGTIFYLYTRMQPGTMYISKRINEIFDEEKDYLIPKEETLNDIYCQSQQEYGFFRYLHRNGKYPVYNNAAIKYFPMGEDKFEELLHQLERAEKYIFLEYFIIDKGTMLNRVMRILARKAKEGVEVRLMYDGTCMLSLLPKNYPSRLKKLGIKCKVFSPMKPFLTTHQNNRDHRKIAVIDGRTAFTGGINIADEYINKRERFGHWKDTAIMVQGEAVDSFTLMFLQMWNINEKVKEDFSKYMHKSVELDEGMRTGGYIAPYGDSPFDDEEVGEKVYLDILNRAKKYVHIMSPYLILDEELINCLTYAVQRGVEVKLILPHIPDKKYAYLLARTYYEDLIKEGVEIYEYTPGFVHAKVFTSDDEKAVVGTINLDFRSLYLHFECAAYIWRNPVIDDIEKDFRCTLEKCQRISMEDCREYSFGGQILGRILRFVAPLM